jgi:hypothetical protein
VQWLVVVLVPVVVVVALGVVGVVALALLVGPVAALQLNQWFPRPMSPHLRLRRRRL